MLHGCFSRQRFHTFVELCAREVHQFSTLFHGEALVGNVCSQDTLKLFQELPVFYLCENFCGRCFSASSVIRGYTLDGIVQHFLDTLYQDLAAERFDDVVAGPGSQAAELMAVVTERRKVDDGWFWSVHAPLSRWP